MDLLSGYDSDSNSAEPAENRRAGAPKAASGDGAYTTALAAQAAPARQVDSGVRSALSHLPVPKGASAVKQQARIFRVPLDISSLADSDEEEEQPAKKAKVAKGSMTLKDFLPAPKNTSSLAASLPPPKPATTQSKPINARSAHGNGDTAYSNEQFRVHNLQSDAEPSTEPQAHMQYQPHHMQQAQAVAYTPVGEPVEYDTDHAQQWGGDAHTSAPASADNAGERMLAEAMAAENAKAQREAAKDPFAGMGVKFKEIKQSSLTHMDVAAKEAANATRTAFGSDYEARLRDEAGAKPDKQTRRKHQISSLYHAAKIKELESMEIRSQGIKTKMETQAKYGW